MLCYLVNTRNQAESESPEESKFLSALHARDEFCSVGPPRAGRVLHCFQVNHQATYCVLRFLNLDIKLTSCAYVHSLPRARLLPQHTALDRARAAAQVPHHFDGAQANWFLFALLIALI